MIDYGGFTSWPRLRSTLNPDFGILQSSGGAEHWANQSVLAYALLDLMVATTSQNAICAVCGKPFIKIHKNKTCGDPVCVEEFPLQQNRVRYPKNRYKWKSTAARLKAPA